MFCGTTFQRCSKSECVRNRSRSFCDSSDFAKEKTSDMVHGRCTRWISLCRRGRALSQQPKALETSDGVQTEMWLQFTSRSSNTYVSPLICATNKIKIWVLFYNIKNSTSCIFYNAYNCSISYFVDYIWSKIFKFSKLVLWLDTRFNFYC